MLPEKAMVPHSSILAWKIPWMEKPGRLQSMGSRRVRHDWATSLSLFTFMHWRRKWQPTPVFLPGESQWRQSLVGCRLWGRTESDTTEVTRQQQQQQHECFHLDILFCKNMEWTGNKLSHKTGRAAFLCQWLWFLETPGTPRTGNNIPMLVKEL